MINLIGISGKAGAGKNTVADMIQYLTNHPEQTQSFKSFMGQWRRAPHLLWEQKQWAKKVKEIATLLTGIPIKKFEDQEFKRTELPAQWSTNHPIWLKPEMIEDMAAYEGVSVEKHKEGLRHVKDSLLGEVYLQDRITPMTVRELLQKIGTDCMREHLHPNVWVNALMSEYVGKPATILHDDCPVNYSGTKGVFEITEAAEIAHSHVGLLYPQWLITDTRFPNEAQAIKDKGGIVVRVERPQEFHPDFPVSTHPSEIALDNWEFDYTINNIKSKEILLLQVKTMLQHYDLIKM